MPGYQGGAANQVFDNRSASFTAGTAAQITTTATPCKWVVVQALGSNTKPLTIGASTVVHASASRRGITLEPGDATDPLEVGDVSRIYVDTEVNSEGVQYFYAK